MQCKCITFLIIVAPIKYGRGQYLNPNLISKKLQKHLINIKTDNDMCLLYCVSQLVNKLTNFIV